MNNLINNNNVTTNDHVMMTSGSDQISDQIDLNCGNWSKEELQEYYGYMAQYRWWFDGLLVSVVGIIGFVGNSLALLVLSRPSLRDVFHQLLFALACFDILYIVCGGVNYTFKAFRANSDVWTLLYPYVLYPFTHIAMGGTIFMTMAISIERYLGLCHPLLSPHSRKAWFYIIPVVIMAFLLNSPKFFEIEIHYETDKTTNETYPTYRPTQLRTNEHYIKGYQMWTRLFSTALIPVASLLFLNIQIMNDILSSSKKTQRFGSDRRQRKEINLSIVLLCIVLVFFCSHAARILLDVYEFSNMDLFMNCKPHWRPAIFWVSLQYISHFTMILNSSLNFFVYCLVGHTFRRELCRTLGFKTTSDNIISRRSSRFDHTMSTMVANNKASTNGKNGSATSPEKTKLKLAGNSNHENTPELMNLITIENSKEDMIKVESY